MWRIVGAAGALVGVVTVSGPGNGSAWAVASPYVLRAGAGAVAGAIAGLVLAAGLDRLRSGLAPAAGARARARAPRREPIPERVRHEVWRRDRGSCVECGSRARLEFDHIVPVSRGGSNTVRNVELRCEPCNRRKGARI
jgi:hypothetical protein